MKYFFLIDENQDNPIVGIESKFDGVPKQLEDELPSLFEIYTPGLKNTYCLEIEISSQIVQFYVLVHTQILNDKQRIDYYHLFTSMNELIQEARNLFINTFAYSKHNDKICNEEKLLQLENSLRNHQEYSCPCCEIEGFKILLYPPQYNSRQKIYIKYNNIYPYIQKISYSPMHIYETPKLIEDNCIAKMNFISNEFKITHVMKEINFTLLIHVITIKDEYSVSLLIFTSIDEILQYFNNKYCILSTDEIMFLIKNGYYEINTIIEYKYTTFKDLNFI